MNDVQQDYEKLGFTADQIEEIEAGRQADVDISIYAKPEFLAIQMREIRLGLISKVEAQRYADSVYDWFQMQEIREGMEERLDIEKYADPSIPFDVMHQIRCGLKEGHDLSSGKHLAAGILRQVRKAFNEKIDINKYISMGYDEEQLRQIRIALKKELDIDSHLSEGFRGPAIREIRLGLEEKVDVSLYAKEEMNWQQMREIRLGLLQRLNVQTYLNTFYSWQQMREIRLGLEAGIPVDIYSSLMYTEKDMHKMRIALSEDNSHSSDNKGEYRDFSLIVSSDEMQVSIFLNEIGKPISKDEILSALKQKNIVTGIDYMAVGQIVQGKAENNLIVIANGIESEKGRDGWYEFFFDTEVKTTPKVLEDGSVDYTSIEWFTIVSKGDKVALYHGAEEGTPGKTVTGQEVNAKKGKEQPMLIGKGFSILPDQVTYVADIDGKVDFTDNKLLITDVLILDDVNTLNGNIDFNGSVYIRGTVGYGAVIRAGRDILVDGFIETAYLEAGGDIIIKEGNNAGGKGHLRAGNDVRGKFFENARVTAGRDIKANYCMNSELYAGNKIEISGTEGMLVGGNTYAVNSVEASYIGNRIGIATNLTLGRQKWFAKSESELAEKEKIVNQELLLLKNAYYDFRRKYTPEQCNSNPIYIKLEDAIYTKELEMGELHKKRQKCEKEKAKFEKARVIVKRTLFHGVRVDINGVICAGAQLNNVTLKKRGSRVAVYSNR